ncbi:MAG: YbhB/YbcL family Raf kinase inhibitor-like protein [Candidatus Nanohaloarchaea archaeon]
MSNLSLESPAFDFGEKIPEKYGYTEENVNPPLRISGVPEGAESLVLVMDDPDAKPVVGHVFDHWVLYGIPPNTSAIPEGEIPEGSVEGENDYGSQGYGGPNPPDRTHTYVFKLYALDTELGLGPGATKEEVEEAMKGHVLARDTLEGDYSP